MTLFRLTFYLSVIVVVAACGTDSVDQEQAEGKSNVDASNPVTIPTAGGWPLEVPLPPVDPDFSPITPNKLFFGGGGGGGVRQGSPDCRLANLDCNNSSLLTTFDRICCEQLGTVANYLPPGFKPFQRVDNIIVEGCGWATGYNFEGADNAAFINHLKMNGGDLAEAWYNHDFFDVYENRFPVRFRELIEATQGGAPINFIDAAYAVDSNGSAPQKDKINDIIDTQYGGSLKGNTIVIYEFDPPDKFRATQTAYDRRDAWNPYAAISDPTGTLPGPAPGFLTDEIYAPYPDPYGQVYLHPALIAMPVLQLTLLTEITDFFLQHLQINNEIGTTNPFIFPMYAPGDKTVMDFIINSNHQEQMSAYYSSNKFGDNVQVWDIGAEDTYEGAYRHGAEPSYHAAWDMVYGAGAWNKVCNVYPTFFTCFYSHPLASHLDGISKTWDSYELAMCQQNGFVYINSAQLFQGHGGRSNDPTSPYFVPQDPTHWLSPAEINSIGQEQLAHMLFTLWKTGNPLYYRRHSSTVADVAETFEFPATRKVWGPILPYP